MIGDEPLLVLIKFRTTIEQKEALKNYCDRHDLKVSAVLRELVEKFLETVPDQ